MLSSLLLCWPCDVRPLPATLCLDKGDELLWGAFTYAMIHCPSLYSWRLDRRRDPVNLRELSPMPRILKMAF
jgi:hypothetical protein